MRYPDRLIARARKDNDFLFMYKFVALSSISSIASINSAILILF